MLNILISVLLTVLLMLIYTWMHLCQALGLYYSIDTVFWSICLDWASIQDVPQDLFNIGT